MMQQREDYTVERVAPEHRDVEFICHGCGTTCRTPLGYRRHRDICKELRGD